MLRIPRSVFSLGFSVTLQSYHHPSLASLLPLPYSQDCFGTMHILFFFFFFNRHLSNSKSPACQCSTRAAKFKIGHGDRQIPEEASALQMPLFINPYKPFCRYCCPFAVLLQLVGSCWNAPCPPLIFKQHESPSMGKNNQTLQNLPVQSPKTF